MRGKLKLDDNGGCFVCGKLNSIGLKLDFAVEAGEYVTYFTPRKEHQGYVGITHGGLVSAILDEVMVRYLHELGRPAVTAEITVRLKRPAETGRRLRFAARIESENSRVVECSADATDQAGAVIAEANARLMRVE